MDLPREFEKCVAYIGYRNGIGEEQLAGTCVFLGRPALADDLRPVYALTAAHVVRGVLDAGFTPELRVNSETSGGATLFPTPTTWIFAEDSDVDLAAMPLTRPGVTEDAESWDHWALPWTALAPQLVNSTDPRSFYPGDDVFVIGLFYQHKGADRNIPIVRLGSIAAMPEDGVRVLIGSPASPREALVEAYLIELRSQSGLSGSPAFAVETHRQNVRELTLPGTYYTPRSNRPIYLLGLVSSHFDEAMAVHEHLSRDKAKANVGISVVVPYGKIIEFFESNPEVQAWEHQLVEAEKQ